MCLASSFFFLSTLPVCHALFCFFRGLQVRIQNAGTEVVEAKAGAGERPLRRGLTWGLAGGVAYVLQMSFSLPADHWPKRLVLFCRPRHAVQGVRCS